MPTDGARACSPIGLYRRQLKTLFTKLNPRPIQSISCDVCEEYFFNVLLLPFTKIPGLYDQLQKYFLGNSNEIFCNFGLKNYQKVPQRKKVVFWSLQTILRCVVKELSGGGSMALVVGVSDR